MDIIGFLNDVTGNNLLLWKVVAATVVFALAGIQVLLAARLWETSTFPPMSVKTASAVHRWTGRVALALGIIVAISCVAGPAGPITPARVAIHSIFGTVALLTIAAKFTILRIVRKGDRFLPYVGSVLFLCFGALWATSVADYISR
jgi:hypothetical protein